nr:MAG TPA: hypothetical protein [Caudoviricetes sp.]
MTIFRPLMASYLPYPNYLTKHLLYNTYQLNSR